MRIGTTAVPSKFNFYKIKNKKETRRWWDFYPAKKALKQKYFDKTLTFFLAFVGFLKIVNL